VSAGQIAGVVVGSLLAFYVLLIIAGARHQSARPDHRRNTTKTRGNNRA
jgi:hypothetical protein